MPKSSRPATGSRTGRSEGGDPISCPLCRCVADDTIWSEDWITIRRCPSCGFLFTEDRSGDFRDDRFAAEITEFYHWLGASRDERVPLLERRIESIVRRFGLGPGALSVLEVGTGGGALARASTGLGHLYCGLEPFAEDRFEGTVGASSQATIHPIRLEDFEPDQRFDLAVMDNVLEHVEDPVGAVARLLGWLKPGGVLWIQVPNEANLVLKHKVLSRLKKRWITFPGHVNLFTAATLRRCLEEAGAGSIVLGATSASDPVLTRLLLMDDPGLFLRSVMFALRRTKLDVALGRAYWLDAYATPPERAGR